MRRPLLALMIASGLFAANAAADEKDVCVRAVEHAQVVRLDSKLLEAREGFTTCSRAVCPAAIRRDCTRWLTEVEASLPSVILQAVWVDGREARGTTVLVDGKPVATDMGRAVALDPGEHAFRFEVAGAAPFETRNVLREGDKNRILRVTLTPLAPTLAPYQNAPVTVPTPPEWTSDAPTPLASTGSEIFRSVPPVEGSAATTRRAPVPLVAYVLGGVALAGLGGLAYLGLKGTNQLDNLRSTCGHDCNPSDVNGARNQILAGDILGAVGLVAAGIAVWLTLARPELPATAAR
jgi:hypothetical protein